MHPYNDKDEREKGQNPFIRKTMRPLSAVSFPYHPPPPTPPPQSHASVPYNVYNDHYKYTHQTNRMYPPPPPPLPPPPYDLSTAVAMDNTPTSPTITGHHYHHHHHHHHHHHPFQADDIQYTHNHPRFPTAAPTFAAKNQQDISSPTPSPLPPTHPVNEPAVIYRTSLSLSSEDNHPPPADSRYIVIDEGNASPRLIKPVSQRFPKTSQVNIFAGKHHGDENSTGLGILCTPLAVPSEDFQNDDSIETVPVIYNSDNPRGEVTKPLRCAHCSAYWNPNVCIEDRHVDHIIFRCNFCHYRNTITEHENVDINNVEVTDLPLKYGTVEYEVEGEYITKKDAMGHQLPSAVHLFALDANDGPLLQTYLSVIASVAKEMEQTWTSQRIHQQKFQNDNENMDFIPRIGFLLYVQDHIVIPHWKKKRFKTDREYVYVDRNEPMSGNSLKWSKGEWEIDVSLMTDIKDDPFCPLPLDIWTYPVFQIKPSLESPQISMFYEILDKVLTLLDGIFPDYNFNIRRQNIIYDQNDPTSWNCSGAALAVMADCIKHDIRYSGGCGTVLTHSRPNYGCGALDDRQGSDASKYFNASSEKVLLTSRQILRFHGRRWKSETSDDHAANFYYELGRKCLEDSVTLNIIYSSPLGHENGSGMTGRHYIDISTLGELCRQTCGSFRWIKAHITNTVDSNGLERDTSYAIQLKHEILRTTITHMGFDSVFKVRVSSGLQIKCFLPSQFVPGATTTGTFDSPGQILSSVMPDTCLAVEIDHRIGGVPYDLDKDGHRLKDVDPTVYFQTALLYTNSFGRRRLRVLTLALKTTTKMIQVYNSVNFDVIAAYMTRQAVNDYASHGEDGLLMNVRKRIADRCFGILANYTTCCDTRAQSKSQLLIPEKMKLLPLVCMGLKKSRMFRQSLPTSSSRTCRPSPSADERAYHIIYSSNISPSMAFLNLYPSLYDVTNLNENIGETVTLKPSSHLRSHGSEEDIKIQMASIAPYIQLPFTIRSSISTVNDGGIYLLDDGFTYSLFIGKDINVDVRTEILSIETYQDSQMKERSINISDSDYGIRIKAICSQLRKCYQSSLSPQCSRQVYSPINVILSQGGPGFRVTIDDTLESDFLKLLIEDTSETDVSYADFSMELYRRISDAVR